MVYGTILKEKVWTKKNDKIKPAKNTINYGLRNDSFLPVKKGSFNVSVGGPGNDKYTGGKKPFGVFIVENGSSSKDFAVSKVPFPSPDSLFFTIDDRHLASINPVTKQEVYVIDFKEPKNQIEKIKIQDTVVTYDQFVSQLQGIPDKSWTFAIKNSVYLPKIGLTNKKKVNKFLKAVVREANSLESGRKQDVLLGDGSGVGVNTDRPDRLTMPDVPRPLSPSTLDIRESYPSDLSSSLTSSCLDLDQCPIGASLTRDLSDPFGTHTRFESTSNLLDSLGSTASIFPDVTTLG
jgi:hypothetical protein